MGGDESNGDLYVQCYRWKYEWTGERWDQLGNWYEWNHGEMEPVNYDWSDSARAGGGAYGWGDPGGEGSGGGYPGSAGSMEDPGGISGRHQETLTHYPVAIH